MYDHHGEDNQVWNVDTEGLISSQLQPRLFLTEVQGSLVLGSNKEETVRWTIEEDTGMIRMKKDPIMVITEKCGKLEVVPARDECPQQIWDIIDADKEIESAAKPATSCHLKYPIPDSVDLDSATDWELRCSVKVILSHFFLLNLISFPGDPLLLHHLLLRGWLGPGRLLRYSGGWGGQESGHLQHVEHGLR